MPSITIKKRKLKLTYSKKQFGLEIREDRVLVQPILEDKTTGSGFILPTGEQATMRGRIGRGYVRGKGPDVMSVKEGDEIRYSHWAPDEVRLGEQDMLLIREDEILLKIEYAED